MPASRDPRQSGLGAATPFSLLRNGEQVAREGRAIIRFIDDMDNIGPDHEVITDARMVFNIPAGRRVLISQLVLNLHTLSDDINVHVGWATLANGGGVFTQLTGAHDLHTGNVQAAPQFAVRDFYPLLMVEYSMGARSVTLQVSANDVAAVLSLEWAGWWENE